MYYQATVRAGKVVVVVTVGEGVARRLTYGVNCFKDTHRREGGDIAVDGCLVDIGLSGNILNRSGFSTIAEGF